MPTLYCRKCERKRAVTLKGFNKAKRPVWECPEGHLQAALLTKEEHD